MLLVASPPPLLALVYSAPNQHLWQEASLTVFINPRQSSQSEIEKEKGLTGGKSSDGGWRNLAVPKLWDNVIVVWDRKEISHGLFRCRLPIESHRYVAKMGQDKVLQHERHIWKHLQDYGYVPLLSGKTFVVNKDQQDLGVQPALLLRRAAFMRLSDVSRARPNHSAANAGVLFIAYNLINCLKFIHSAGVLHRDIHPGNVAFLRTMARHCPWVRSEGLPAAVFIDFGLSLLHGHHPTNPSNQQPPHLLYAACTGGRDYSARDDLESLAYTLITFWIQGEPDWEPEELHGTDGAHFNLRDERVQALLREMHPTLRSFIRYARHLLPGVEINYDEWSDKFWADLSPDFIRLIRGAGTIPKH